MTPERADRLPLGAAQAALPEAHLPRARRGGRSCRSSSSSRRGAPAAAAPRTSPSAATSTTTGLAIPLVLLLFGSIWLFPLITALVAGDIVAAEDHNGTLKTILTRSVERGQIFAGKALAAVTYAIAAILLSGVVAIVAGSLALGLQPAHDAVRARASRRPTALGAGRRRACSST